MARSLAVLLESVLDFLAQDAGCCVPAEMRLLPEEEIVRFIEAAAGNVLDQVAEVASARKRLCTIYQLVVPANRTIVLTGLGRQAGIADVRRIRRIHTHMNNFRLRVHDYEPDASARALYCHALGAIKQLLAAASLLVRHIKCLHGDVKADPCIASHAGLGEYSLVAGAVDMPTKLAADATIRQRMDDITFLLRTGLGPTALARLSMIALECAAIPLVDDAHPIDLCATSRRIRLWSLDCVDARKSRRRSVDETDSTQCKRPCISATSC